MLTPHSQIVVPFLADGASTSMTVDLTAYPFGLEPKGANPVQIATPTLTQDNGQPVPTVTLVTPVVLNGWRVTANFSGVLPRTDTQGNIITYALTFYLELAG